MDAQLPTNLSLSETETEHRTSSPKPKNQPQDMATKFKVPKNPKKRTLQPSPTTTITTNRRRTESESSANMNMQMTQKKQYKQHSLNQIKPNCRAYNLLYTEATKTDQHTPRNSHADILQTNYKPEEIPVSNYRLTKKTTPPSKHF